MAHEKLPVTFFMMALPLLGIRANVCQNAIRFKVEKLASSQGEYARRNQLDVQFSNCVPQEQSEIECINRSIFLSVALSAVLLRERFTRIAVKGTIVSKVSDHWAVGGTYDDA